MNDQILHKKSTILTIKIRWEYFNNKVSGTTTSCGFRVDIHSLSSSTQDIV
jgi:hypothetical protein